MTYMPPEGHYTSQRSSTFNAACQFPNLRTNQRPHGSFIHSPIWFIWYIPSCTFAASLSTLSCYRTCDDSDTEPRLRSLGTVLQKLWHLNQLRKHMKKHASHNHLMAFGIHNVNRGLTPRLSAWWANVEPSASAFAKLQTPQVSQKQDSLSCIMRSYQLLADPTIRDQLLVIFFLIWKDDVHCTMPSDWLRADSSAWAMVAKPWRIWYGKHDDSCANIYRPSKINQNHLNIAFWHQLSSLRWLEGLKINSVNS